MMTSRPAGDAALLVEAGRQAAGLAEAIAAQRLAGVLDVVPGARTVLIAIEPGSWDLAELAGRIRALPVPAVPASSAELIEIPVYYDGPDLAEVARLTGLTVSAVIDRHQAGEYRAGWLGFSPGFGYLTGLDPVLAAVPRLPSPRLTVPAGSVAIAGGLAAVYPASSPGGWRLLGRTATRLWDPAREPPALLAPGMRVRFRAVSQSPGPAPDAADQAAASPHDPAGVLEVVRPGPLATIQDLGRPGFAHLGVPHSGAADAASLRRANELAGNPAGAAGLELTLGRGVLKLHRDAVLAVTGAPARLTLSGQASGPEREVDTGSPVTVPAGSVLRVGPPAAGLRSYLAVRGGISSPAVLGSRSADLLSGLGPRPLRPGDLLAVGGAGAAPGGAASMAAPATRVPGAAGLHAAHAAAELRVIAGPRGDWLEPGALATLTSAVFEVLPASNRTGLRLAGPPLRHARVAELPSEGLVTGAIQVPGDGQPILLLADHPATGGYPVLAVVVTADIGPAAQLRPGQRVRFALSR